VFPLASASTSTTSTAVYSNILAELLVPRACEFLLAAGANHAVQNTTVGGERASGSGGGGKVAGGLERIGKPVWDKE